MRVRQRIDDLRAASRTDQAQAVAQLILDVEDSRESQMLMVDDAPQIFSGLRKRLYRVEPQDGHWKSYISQVYGLNPQDKEVTPKVTAAIAAHIVWNGRKVVPRRWAAYHNGALHLNRYDGTVCKLSGNGVIEGERGFLIDDGFMPRSSWPGGVMPTLDPIRIDIVDNSRDVLFRDDDNGTFPLDSVIGPNGQLFRLLRGVTWSHQTMSGLKPKHQVQALMVWMMAVAYSDLFPTKPLLMVEGAPGSGKTTLLQMIQKTLFGSVDPFTVSKDGERDFWVALDTSPIMILDNTDDMIDWLPDTICAYCTQGYRVERRLHTNTGRVEIRPHSFIAVASKDPRSFRREDTADRTIVLRIENRRFTNGGGESAAAIMANVARMRAQLHGEWIYLQNRVVAALQREPPRRTTTRLGDFETFAYAACRAFGWYGDAVVPPLMAALGRERAVFAAEADVVLDTLADWVAVGENAGRAVSLRDLFRELANFASTNNKPFVRTPQALSQRLRAPHVQLMYEVVDNVVGDKRVYQIWPATTTNIAQAN